jgi:hypothetical protein
MIATTTPPSTRALSGITTPNANSLPARLRSVFGGKIQTMQNFFLLEVAQ